MASLQSDSTFVGMEAVLDIQEALQRSDILESAILYRKQMSNDMLVKAFLTLEQSAKKLVELSCKFSSTHNEVLEIMQLKDYIDKRYWDTLLGQGPIKVVRGSRLHSQLVMLHCRVLFAQHHLPSLVSICDLSGPADPVTLIKSDKVGVSVAAASFVISFGCNGGTESRLSEAARAISCVEAIHAACSVLANDTSHPLSLEAVDLEAQNITFGCEENQVAAIRDSLISVGGAKMLAELSQQPIASQLESMPIYDRVGKIRVFGVTSAKKLDQVVLSLNAAFLAVVELEISFVRATGNIAVRKISDDISDVDIHPVQVEIDSFDGANIPSVLLQGSPPAIDTAMRSKLWHSLGSANR